MAYFFFFSSRRRHTRYWRDWSSDVCSSDLDDASVERTLPAGAGPESLAPMAGAVWGADSRGGALTRLATRAGADRKRVVEGKRGDLGGRRILKKKKIRMYNLPVTRRLDSTT